MNVFEMSLVNIVSSQSDLEALPFFIAGSSPFAWLSSKVTDDPEPC